MRDDLKTVGMAVLAGGAAAGAADIISALGSRPDPLGTLQYIASGLIGNVAFEGGWWTGAAGLAVHFGLTTLMAILFIAAARRWTALLDETWIAGMVYGAVIYAAMFYFIVPVLSAASNWKTPEGFLPNLSGAMLHGFLVGMPIAAAARHYLGKRNEAQA
jgi:hypothetical protein